MTPPITARMHSGRLRGGFVFLSASFPSPAKSAEFHRTARPFEITDAVIAATRAVLGASGKLVFGAHPTVSPLVLSVAKDFAGEFREAEGPAIHIYQTELYRNEIPEETRELESEGLGEIHMIPSVGEDLEESLDVMRRDMLKRSRPMAGGIFIGGMEGVYKPGIATSEFALFKEYCAGRPIYPIGAPGGASQILANRLVNEDEALMWKYESVRPRELLSEAVYAPLMHKIVSDMTRQM